MTKLLNLDELGELETLTIVLNGKEHKLQEMNVADFIWSQKEMKRQEDLKDDVAVFESLIVMLSRQFPTADPDEFRLLKMSKLRALMDFVNTLATKGAQGAAAAAATENPQKAEQTA